MSGSIGRQYLIQSWANAGEYSGEMIGNRLKSSTQMYLPNGKANIEAFKEEPVKKSSKKEEPLEYKLYPQQKAYDKLEALVQDIERKYLNLEISDEEYTEAMDVLEPKLAKAWTALCKAKGWWEECEELSPKEKAIQKEVKKRHAGPFIKMAWVVIGILIVKSFFAMPV